MSKKKNKYKNKNKKNKKITNLPVAVVGVILVLGMVFFGYSRANTRNISRNVSPSSAAQLAAPSNLSISVTGRLMTVTWDAVENARGYIIRTESPGCASGNRIINTATKTVTNHAGASASSGTAENGITNRGNGFVTFTGDTSFTIWLMAEAGSETEAMATSLTARAMAVGDGTASEYSTEVRLVRSDYAPAR